MLDDILKLHVKAIIFPILIADIIQFLRTHVAEFALMLVDPIRSRSGYRVSLVNVRLSDME